MCRLYTLYVWLLNTMSTYMHTSNPADLQNMQPFPFFCILLSAALTPHVFYPASHPVEPLTFAHVYRLYGYPAILLPSLLLLMSETPL